MTVEAVEDGRGRSRALLWILGLLPVVLLAALLAVILRFDPAAALRGDVPPVEVLHFQRVVLGPDGIVATVLNDGPDPVTIAQVQVDEAYWPFTVEPERELAHLESATLHIPYPWVWGEAHELRVVTATGLTFDHTIEVAVETPRPSGRYFFVFALIGTYVGVLPVALGLLWHPVLRRAGRRTLDFLLALTVGLLVFLFVDGAHEGLEAAVAAPASFQGVVLFVLAALTAYLAIDGLGAWLGGRGRSGSGWAMALLIAIGIGLHNFGEGLAIGAAYALGEAALGALLIVGFALHNTTEGLAIVAPLGGTRTGLGSLALLGAVAGIPTIAGAWIGGFVYSPTLAVVFLAVGAGAIAQVVIQIVRALGGARKRGSEAPPLAPRLRSGPVLAGLLAGFAVMYLTGLLIG
jgi:zinc transporter ZupT